MNTQQKDTYLTLKIPTPEIIYKEKGSKFLGYAFPVNTEEEIKNYIDDLKKQHHSARHWCYAWQLGTESITYRANDDGEPNNSAGMPIFGQIQSFNITNVLIVVVRYFGGVKLGVGGLITAYRETAKIALENGIIIEKIIKNMFTLTFEYKDMNKVMRVLKENAVEIVNQNLELQCKFIIAIRKSESDKIQSAFKSLFNVKITQSS